jgi:hypothetical protein
VQNNTTGCFVSGSDFDILVNPKPMANAPLPYFVCDYDTTNANGFVVYDLNALVPAILGTTRKH